jgi:hypothetical protein
MSKVERIKGFTQPEFLRLSQVKCSCALAVRHRCAYMQAAAS